MVFINYYSLFLMITNHHISFSFLWIKTIIVFLPHIWHGSLTDTYTLPMIFDVCLSGSLLYLWDKLFALCNDTGIVFWSLEVLFPHLSLDVTVHVHAWVCVCTCLVQYQEVTGNHQIDLRVYHWATVCRWLCPGSPHTSPQHPRNNNL